MAKISLRIQWGEPTEATLIYVVHNNKAIGGPPLDGTGLVTLTYEVPDSPIHFAAFGLLFLEKKLTNLEAWMAVDGRSPEKITANDSATNFWKGHGAV